MSDELNLTCAIHREDFLHVEVHKGGDLLWIVADEGTEHRSAMVYLTRKDAMRLATYITNTFGSGE